jgi:AcrR family transcriptional regulator
MPRKYEMRRRAERQRETRERIVDAAMQLHATLGPARTSVKAVADTAGVQRHTVYRHFPTDEDLFGACTSAWDARNPFPNPSAWDRVEDPAVRLRHALLEVYRYYRRVEADLALFVRDADLVPSVRRAFEEDAATRRRIRDGLARGWRARGRARTALLAAIGHALEFTTWRSLARSEGLDDEHAAELMTRFARAAAGGGRSDRPRGR